MAKKKSRKKQHKLELMREEVEMATILQKRAVTALRALAVVLTDADRCGLQIHYGPMVLFADEGGRRFDAPKVGVLRLVLG